MNAHVDLEANSVQAVSSLSCRILRAGKQQVVVVATAADYVELMLAGHMPWLINDTEPPTAHRRWDQATEVARLLTETDQGLIARKAHSLFRRSEERRFFFARFTNAVQYFQ